jgi:pimeloyl-ACP methyl ester carboxylesterase
VHRAYSEAILKVSSGRDDAHSVRGGPQRSRLVALLCVVSVLGIAVGGAPTAGHAHPRARTLSFRQPGWPTGIQIRIPGDVEQVMSRRTIEYTTFDGVRRRAIVLMPVHVRPGESLPLVISPHGRGVPPEANSLFWGDLPGRDRFILVMPAGMGRHLALFSWGYRGQIDDLARMPDIVAAAIPDVHIDRRRIYAMGGSMGGQEVLLLLAQHPHLLAGVAAFDAPTDMIKRYPVLGQLQGGAGLQLLTRRELGGTPQSARAEYLARSPLTYAAQIARSGVPLQIWWSHKDAIVKRQFEQSGAFVKAVLKANPHAPLVQVEGDWEHALEMLWDRRLPSALARFGITPTA